MVCYPLSLFGAQSLCISLGSLKRPIMDGSPYLCYNQINRFWLAYSVGAGLNFHRLLSLKIK